jgi:hypothetical protein
LLPDCRATERPVAVWHALGAKTLDLINEHVQVEMPRTDMETIVLDVTLIEDLIDRQPHRRGSPRRPLRGLAEHP